MGGARMQEPRLWNTLAEAAAWLAAESGEAWDERRVLDAVVKWHLTRERLRGEPPNPPTILRAAPPADAVINLRRFVSPRPEAGDAMPIVARLPWQTAPLFVQEVAQLIASGEARCGTIYARQVDGAPVELQTIEPPMQVTFANVGIAWRDLPALLLTAREPVPATAPPPGAALPNPRRARADLMAGEIDAALAELGATVTLPGMMRVLASFAGRPGSCIIEAGAGFVLWRNADGKPQKLTRDLLRKRLGRLAEAGRK